MSLEKREGSSDIHIKDDVEQIDHCEAVEFSKDQTDLSGIESTAASKAAWLISIVVSIGGLLFGT